MEKKILEEKLRTTNKKIGEKLNQIESTLDVLYFEATTLHSITPEQYDQRASPLMIEKRALMGKKAKVCRALVNL